MQGEDQRRGYFSHPSQTSCELRLLGSILGGKSQGGERCVSGPHMCAGGEAVGLGTEAHHCPVAYCLLTL